MLGSFAESYQFLIQDEIQSYHWSKEYCTLHPVVAYFKDDKGSLRHISICFISDDNSHNTCFVRQWSITFMNYYHKSKSSFTFLMDVGGSIKITKTSWICLPKQDFGLDAEWIFFATSHDKSPCDGTGGSVKRHATKKDQRPMNN